MRNFVSFIIASIIYTALIFLILNQPSSSFSLPEFSLNWEEVAQMEFTDTDPIAELRKAEEAEAARIKAEKEAAEKARAEAKAKAEAEAAEKAEQQRKAEEKRIADLKEKERKKKELKKKEEQKKLAQQAKKFSKKESKKIAKTKTEAKNESLNKVDFGSNFRANNTWGSSNLGSNFAKTGSNLGGKSSGSNTGKVKGTGENSANYNKALQALINKNCQRRYPKKEERNGVSASLAVAFSVAPNGTLTNIRISRSSGNSLFDEAALAGVRAVGSFRPTPDGKTRAFNIPISFRPRR